MDPSQCQVICWRPVTFDLNRFLTSQRIILVHVKSNMRRALYYKVVKYGR